MVHVPREQKLVVYRHLWNTGVCVVRKDSSLRPHELLQMPDGTPIPNMHVMILMRSLTSRGIVRQTFSWQHSYYTLTEDGFKSLQTELGLPDTAVPQIKEKNIARPPRTGERRTYRRRD